MKKYGRDNRPYVKPVKRIELSEKNIKLRWILIVVLLSIAVVSILIGLTSMLNTEPGWQAVEVSSDQPNCGSEFTLMYDFSGSGTAATAQYKQLTSLYSDAAENAYRIFSPELLEEGLNNAAYLNAHVNETVAVDETLYRALALVVKYSDRHVFLAPATVEYNRVFLCENDAEAARYDPARDPDTAAWLAELSHYTNDPQMISLEVLGENQARLNVSEEYLEFAEEYGIETFLDFGWMKNAFIADYLADVLTENGFTNGYLASYDGFTRNLDARSGAYSQNIFAREGSGVDLPARLTYSGPMSLVALRNYPMDELDKWHFYAFETGEIVTALLDPADCMSKSSLNDLLAYSPEQGCAEILLQTAPVFIADSFDAQALERLTQTGIHSIRCQDKGIVYTEAEADLTVLAEGFSLVHSVTEN